jgi:hypothetical protein
MLALLLALSPGAVAMQASAPMGPPPSQTEIDAVEAAQSGSDTVRPETDGNTTTVMTLGTAPSRTAFDSPSLALGNSLAMDRDGFRTQLRINSLDEQLKTADNVEKKKQILNRYRYHIENRIISLKATERKATQAFSNGTISESEYLRTLGQIDAEAERIRTAIDVLKTHAEPTNFGIDAYSLKAKLATVEGPVRDRIAKTLQGRANPTRIYVETAESGIVLSTIVDGTYVREIFRADNRDPSQQESISVQNAMEEVLQPQYPWVSNPNHWTGSGRRVYSPIQSIKYTYDYSHGSLTAYVDTGTAKVYREVQYKELTDEHSVPPGPAVENSSENVTVTVSRTYAGGPLRVKLTNATGTPIRGEVAVAGEPVGRTNPNGVLWTLGPAEQFRVSATYEETTVNVTVTPVDSSQDD